MTDILTVEAPVNRASRHRSRLHENQGVWGRLAPDRAYPWVGIVTFVAGGRRDCIMRLMVPVHWIDAVIICTEHQWIGIGTVVEATANSRLTDIGPVGINIGALWFCHTHTIAVVSSRSVRRKPWLWPLPKVSAAPSALAIHAIGGICKNSR